MVWGLYVTSWSNWDCDIAYMPIQLCYVGELDRWGRRVLGGRGYMWHPGLIGIGTTSGTLGGGGCMWHPGLIGIWPVWPMRAVCTFLVRVEPTYKVFFLQSYHYWVNPFIRSDDESESGVICISGTTHQLGWATWFWREGCYREAHLNRLGVGRAPIIADAHCHHRP